jgi:hypothetical protein
MNALAESRIRGKRGNNHGNENVRQSLILQCSNQEA